MKSSPYNDLLKDYLQVWHPTPEDHLAYLLASIYTARTEAYDRKVCTGPTTRDGVMPMNPDEHLMINRHALRVRDQVARNADRLKVNYALVKKWIGRL